MKKKRPVLQDVADLVGVTKMTVSRYLRNPEQVSEALRGKIAVALDELGYIPNRAPDILSNATSRAIGVLLPSLTNQVFSEVLRGIESVTDAFGLFKPCWRTTAISRKWKRNASNRCSPGTLMA